MSMSVSGVGGVGFTPYVAPTVSPTAAGGPSATSGQNFGNLVLDGIDRLEQVQDKSDQLAVKAATGDLNAIHDYTIAATEANVTTQLTVAVRNKAVEAFNEIMRMQV
jgi:flagellar hook-basal body complex protein FliE